MSKPKYTIVQVEITRETLEYLEKQADANDLSLESYIEDILEKQGH